MQKIVSIIAAFFLFSSFSNSNWIEEGKSFYANRADGAVGINSKPENITKAKEFFQKAFDKNENKDISGLYLMRCHIHIGRFVDKETESKKQSFIKAKSLGEQLVKSYPSSAAIRFEYVSAIGLWAEQVGAMKSAREGVLGDMKTHTEALFKIDSMFNHGSPFKIMGILHLRTPYIPLFLTWPSDKEGGKLLLRAVKHFPNDHGNNVYLAEYFEKVGQKDKAKQYLKRALEIPCRNELLLEDRAFKIQAEAKLKKLNS